MSPEQSKKAERQLTTASLLFAPLYAELNRPDQETEITEDQIDHVYSTFKREVGLWKRSLQAYVPDTFMFAILDVEHDLERQAFWHDLGVTEEWQAKDMEALLEKLAGKVSHDETGWDVLALDD